MNYSMSLGLVSFSVKEETSDIIENHCKIKEVTVTIVLGAKIELDVNSFLLDYR